ILDRDLAPASLRAFNFHIRRLASLLIDLLVCRRLVLDVKLGRRVRLEKEDLRFGRNAMIYLVHDRPTEFESLQISRLPVGVRAGEDPVAFRQPEIDQVRPNEELFRQLDYLIMAIFKNQQYLVEFRAFDIALSS